MAVARSFQRPANVTFGHLLNLFRITMFFNFGLNHTREDFQLFSRIMKQNNYTVRQLTERISPDCMEMISKCMWKGTNTRCDSLFQRVKAIESVCCSFNYYGLATNNFPEKIAYQVAKRPYRVTGCGYATGLTIVLNPIVQDYFGTYFSSYGFRLLIHDSYNFPDDNAETKVVTSSRESFVRITPEATYATQEVKNMDISLRECLFSSERRLSTMQRYSFSNCMAECRVSLLYHRCRCIPWNLPNNGSFRVCDVEEIECVVKTKDIFIRALPSLENSLSLVKDTKTFPCNCLPDCEMNNYASEITMGRLDMKFVETKLYSDKSVNVNEQILLHIFFSDLMATRYRMEIFQNWLSSLASFGGLLGLIMGFSIVTAFEFFYFLTFRPIFNYFND